MKLTFEEIIEKLKKVCEDVDDFAYFEDIPFVLKEGSAYEQEKFEYAGNTYYKIEDIGLCKQVHQQGGEGEGDHWESVTYFPEHDVYIKVVGFYSSYNGTDFSGWSACQQVIPREKTITVYE